MHELHEALDGVAADDETRCVVLRGEGRGVSAGADLKSGDLSREDRKAPDLGEYLRRTCGRTVTKIAGGETGRRLAARPGLRGGGGPRPLLRPPPRRRERE